MNGTAKQRISYVLPLGRSDAGHRLGVNGLDVDRENGLLYTAGRDGALFCWQLPWRAGNRLRNGSPPTIQAQSQAHMHWINDITLVYSNEAVVSASSDLSVKLWRPRASGSPGPVTIGLHNDYVKCVAKPLYHSDWVASGGLDRKIRLLDLRGGGEKLQIDVGNGGENNKGSIYSLAAGDGLIASGGPDCIVRLWDPRSGHSISKLEGHSDNVRAIMLSHGGHLVMSASSDNTIKLWSTHSNRCISTLSIHSDSVWSLFTEDADLQVFYSSDRSGLLAKTDWRGQPSPEQGLSVALCQEPNGVTKLIATGDSIWTATTSSSVNEWRDMDLRTGLHSSGTLSPAVGHQDSTEMDAELNSSVQQNPTSLARLHPRASMLSSSDTQTLPHSPSSDQSVPSNENTGDSPSLSEATRHANLTPTPIQHLPYHTIAGQHGLTKSRLLSDRRRALTVDTAGLVTLWDLIKCQAVQSFGKRAIDDVFREVDGGQTVVNWCLVDVRSGNLACTLDEDYCFDGEVYADELNSFRDFEYREDQRINLGKWLMRSLFEPLISAEQDLDDAFLSLIKSGGTAKHRLRANAPLSIGIPSRVATSSGDALTTPGLGIAVATPLLPVSAAQPGVNIEDRTAQSATRTSAAADDAAADRPVSGYRDYFSGRQITSNAVATTPTPDSSSKQSNEGTDSPKTPTAEPEKESNNKRGGFKFGEKIRLSLGSKRGGRSPALQAKEDEVEDPAIPPPAEPELPYMIEEPVQPNFLGVLQVTRNAYRQHLREKLGSMPSSQITPLTQDDVPLIRVPSNTIILIQEDRPEMGGTVDLYRGTVSSLRADRELIEKVAPYWLGEAVLQGKSLSKDIVKVSFILKPYQELLPDITSGQDGRLNANRLLRTRKILGYIDERLRESVYAQAKKQIPPIAVIPRPDEALQLYCQDKLVPPTTTLLALRSQWWKAGGDIQLTYRSTGKISFPGERTPEQVAKANLTLSGSKSPSQGTKPT